MQQTNSDTGPFRKFKKPVPKWIRITFICTVVLIVWVLIDLFTVVGGNIRFYNKWIECGEKPYVVGAAPFASISYYKKTPVIAPFSQYRIYFCNPLEAEKAGVSASPSQRTFPNLEQKGLTPPWPPELPRETGRFILGGA